MAEQTTDARLFHSALRGASRSATSAPIPHGRDRMARRPIPTRIAFSTRILELPVERNADADDEAAEEDALAEQQQQQTTADDIKP